MLKNKIIGKKIRNIVILLMAIIVMIGAYKYIDRSRAENVIEVDAIALDNYGYLEEEEFKLEAKQLDDGSYEIELPESVNTKKINRIVKIGLGELEKIPTENQETILEDGLELLENRIYLTKEQIESEKISLEVEYDVVIAEDRTLYSKILKYEDKENGKLVELRGYLPVDAELQVEEVPQGQLTEIFGEKKIKVAYDIKILQKVITEVPADEANPDSKPTQIVETVEINPEDYGEKCEVTIKDVSIAENSEVYHVKEDNTYEQVNIKENTEGNVSFEAQSFSVYAITDGEIEPDPGEATGYGTPSWRITGLKNNGSASDSGYSGDWYYTVYSGYSPEFTGDCESGNGVCWTDGNGVTNVASVGENCSYVNKYHTGFGKTVNILKSGTFSIMGYITGNSHVNLWARFHITYATKPTTPTSVTYSYADGSTYTPGTWTNKAVYATSGPTGSTSDDNVCVYQISTNNSSWSNYSYSSTNSTYAMTTEGTHTRYFRAVNDSGFSSSSISAVAKIDLTPPTAGTMTMKLGSSTGSDYTNNTWTNQDVYIALNNGSDALSGHKSTTYTVTKDGAAYSSNQTAAKTLTSTGTYTIVVTTTDNAGNTATNSYTVKIDKTKPTAGTMTMKLGSSSGSNYTNNTWTKQNVYIALNNDASDALSGVKSTTYTVTKDGAAYLSNQTSATTLTEDGLYVITVTTSDNAGNTAKNSYQVKIDRVDPIPATLAMKLGSSTGSNYTNNTWTKQNVYIALNDDASDATSGVSTTTYTVKKDGVAYSSNQTAAQILTQEGTYTITVTTTDVAGNSATGSTYTVKIDKTKPVVKYTHQTTDINTGNKTYTMTFTVTDEHYSTGQLTLNDLTIMMQNGQKDSDGNAIIYNLKELSSEGVNVALRAEEKMENEQLVGHTYTLTISNLEQLEIKDGLATAGYSGIVTVAIPANKITDLAGNTNDATTITSGVDIPGGTLPDDAVVVDVVDPMWTKVSSSITTTETTIGATLTIRGTDTYWNTSTLTSENIDNAIKVIVNGTEITTGITKTLVSTTPLTEERLKNNGLGTTEGETVQYGEEYTITITGEGSLSDVNQIKIQIPKGVLADQYGNDSEEKDLIVYNVLKSASSEEEATSEFLGESVETTLYPQNPTSVTPIARQDIEKVVFLNDISGYDFSDFSGVQRIWDVSAQGDASIVAITTNTTAPYTVYIISEAEIFANQDSRRLFKYIGYANTCTATETITNLSLLNVKNVINMSYMFQYCGYNAMTSLILPDTFDTSNVQFMRDMFGDCGLKSMTRLDLGNTFDTSNVTDMYGMFWKTGATAMTSLDLGAKFNTGKVNDMSNMFLLCGVGAMTSLNLGTNFDTTNVTDMRMMFTGCGYTAMTSLDLGEKFDTSKVTNMYRMFMGCGYTAMTSLDLGDKFNTANVTDMQKMFDGCGYTSMTSLDLGDLFYTTSATDMYKMFSECGATSMTSLDLGPAFTEIPGGAITKQASDYDSWEPDQALEYNAYEGLLDNTGKSGACTIYASESIYKNQNAFKLSSTDTTETPTGLNYTRGTIIPIYKPEWTKESSAYDAINKTLSVTVKGSAYKTQQVIDSNVTINYASDVISTLTAEDITVYVNGVEVTSTTNPTVTVNAGTTSTNAGGATDITHTIVLSNLEEAARRANLPYKELSGNIKIKIGGRGEATSTYYDSANAILKDQYGNQNMMETDEGQTDGTWIDVTYSDPDTDHNTDNTMFTDFIKPEFTYEASNTIIGNGNHGNTKKVTVVFDVTDKYFSNTELATDTNADLITVKVDNDIVNGTVNVTKTLTKKNDIILNTQTNVVTYQATGYTLGTNERKVGERYELLVEGLEQLDENGLSNGYTYSGPMSVAFPSGKVTDLSGNVNDAITITIGVDDTDGNPNTEYLPSTSYTTPYLPNGYSYVEGDLNTGLVIADPLGNEYVWVEVPRTGAVYPTAGLSLDLDNLTGTELTNAYNAIETDLHTYTNTYRRSGHTDTYYSDETTGLTETQYNELKQKMLRSVYQNGGFYVGRYETGIENEPKTLGSSTVAPTETPVIKQNAYPYNLVTCSQAQTLASSFASQLDGYTSSLMFVVQWDLVLRYLESKGATQSELNSNSTSWGNHKDSIWNITNASSKYSTDTGSTWTSGAYGEKTSSESVFLSTGASDTFSKQNIYDLAGNIWEYTLGYTSVLNDPCDIRGGSFNSSGTYLPASSHYCTSVSGYNANVGLRVTLYKDVDLSSDSNAPEIVDVVDPVWELGEVDLNNSTIKLIAKDKYFDAANSNVTVDDITVYVNGVESTAVIKDITSVTPTDIVDTINGVETVVGKEYTLQLSNITPAEAGYTTFTPTNLTTDSLNNNAGFKYRDENGGDISIKIAAGTIKDQSGNTSREQDFEIGKIDATKPEVYDVQKIQDATANTETFVFNVTDRNYAPSDLVTEDEITVWIDGEQVTSIGKSITSKEIKADIDGTTKVLGHQYTLVLSNIAETTYQTGKDYLEYSGTVEIRIAENAAKDLSGNTLNTSTTTLKDFVDFAKPDLKYTYQSTDNNTGTKKYTMTFEVTDKYYTSGQLSLNDLTILMQNGQYQRDANGDYVLDGDGNKIPQVYDLKQLATEGKINIAFNGAEKTATFNKTVSGTVTNGTYTIGHTYTLTISNLEQLAIKEGNTTLDYSGIITVGIAADKVKDNGPKGDGTNPNGNVGTTITSGISISAGTETGTATPADVVDPIWTKVNSSITTTETTIGATLTIRGTDTYWSTSTLTSANIDNAIKVIINGTEVTTGITKTLVSTTELKEDRIVNGENTSNVKYGEEYTITITGEATLSGMNQIKVQIPKGVLVDQNGNDSELEEFIVYNVLKSANSETEATSAFLGESVGTTLYPEGVTEVTSIARQDIEKVVFSNDITGYDFSDFSGVQRVWDVSAQGDASIVAITTNTAAPYTVYIISEAEIFANQDSSNLFRYIGYGDSCTATETITNINLLNTSNVISMNHMFSGTGYKSMTGLDLGDKFDTSSVVDMASMFSHCGYTAMTNLNLGDKFDTSGVINMSWMFFECGYTAVTSLNLGSNFDTSNVVYMGGMFYSCGYTAMTSLNLGDKFDTSSVTDMSNMFRDCGYTAMTSLNLGDKFDTSSVTDMSQMFARCGFTAMTSLNLGDKFDTNSVTDMSQMFAECGVTAMTSLNLGDKFDTSSVTDMSQMFAGCGVTAMTSLNLGDKFDTSSVTNMYNMFLGCGAMAMTALDLGPAFTNIPDGTVTHYEVEHSAHEIMFLSCGKEGALTIYAPEAIYKSQNTFKLNSTDTETTISIETYDFETETVTGARGATIIPIYKPEWEKLSSAYDATDKTLSVTVKGSAYKSQVINSNVTINYASDVTSTLEAGDITVYVNGVEVTNTVNPTVTVNAGATSTNETSEKTEITHTIVLSNLEEAARRADLPYKELSGNIKIKIAGRGQDTTTYTANVLTDQYGNQNMMETDEGQTAGTWIDVTYSDPDTDHNTDNTMFADFIKPEFTYEASNTIIGDGNHGNTKKVTVVFDVTDKYFSNTELATDTNADLITVKVDNDIVNGTVNVTKTLTKKNDIIINTQTNAVTYQATGYTLGTNERKIGERYELLVEGLEQLDENGLSNGYTYSGPMSIAFPSGKVTDSSGNVNDATTITIGVDEPNTDYTNPYLPTGYTRVAGTDLSNGLTIQDSLGNQYVWVEVPRTTEVYPTAGLNITSFTDTEYGLIEDDLHAYTSIYRNEESCTDYYFSDETTGLTQTQYNELKQKMLKSVYQNGGFYVGKYETGTESQTPVIKQNAYPYSYVKCKQAQYLSSQFASQLEGYTSSLMFGVQWNLVLKYLETKGATQAELKSNSTNWGNYHNNLWNITNTNAKYYYNSSWTSGTYEKTSEGSIKLTTGASETFSKQGIYDLAGNVSEWTLECTYPSNPCTVRGGSYELSGVFPANYSEGHKTIDNAEFIGFRVALYKDELSESGTIVDVVDPVWELGDVDLENATIKLIAKDKYFDECTIDETKITVYTNGVESTTIVKDITSIAPTNVLDTVGGVANTVVGKEYTLQLSNIIPAEAGYTTFTPTNLTTDSLNNNAGFKYRDENGGDISIKIAAGTIKDQSGNTSREQDFEIGKIDATKPEVYDVQKIQDATANTETFIFNVTDRNYDPSDLVTEGEITVWVDGTQVTSIGKVITNKPIKLDIDGETGKILGHQYTLVLSNIAEAAKQAGKDYLEYSGTVEIRIAESAAKDLNGNTLNSDTTTISDFVDYIKPVIEPVTVTNSIDRTNKTYTMSFNVIDKYLDTTNMVTENEITVYVDGEEASSITKTLTRTPITATFKKTVAGAVEATATSHVIGHTYTLVLSDFEETVKQSGKDFMEWSGTVKIEIAENAVNDTSNNTFASEVAKRTVNGEHVDYIKPVVEKVTSTIDSTAKTETIIFNVMDKYLDTSDALTDSEISVYVDNEVVASGITKALTKVQDFTATVNGDGAHVVGQQYRLVLSGFEQASRNAKDYKDWSGTVKIEIAENAVKDTELNTLAPEVAKRTVDGDFVDFIKPDLEYIHQDTDIDHGNKTYTMTFDVTDKYYTSGQLSLNDLTVLMQNGQYQRDTSGNYVLDENGDKIPQVYDLKQLATEGKINIVFNGVEKTATFNKTVAGTVTNGEYTIGHTYALTISNLEQLAIKEGNTTLDYSGIITVGVAADKVKDNGPSGNGTNPNGNTGTTITSGVDITGGTESGTAMPVDVVDPIWTKVSSTAYAIDPANKTSSTATITFRGTDTYFNTSTLTINDIKVIVNGSEVTTGITKTLDSTTELKEERIVDGVNTPNVKYGEEYTVTIKGFAQNANQVKIQIPAGIITDQSGNGNKTTDLIVYNTLRYAGSETEATSQFLGSTDIQRQDIENVTFVNNMSNLASGLIRSYDATNNTASGHSNSTTTWRDLSGGRDGIVNGGTWGTDYLQLDGVDDWVNIGEVSLADKVTLDVTITANAIQSGEVDILCNYEAGGAGIDLRTGVPTFLVFIKDVGYVSVQAGQAITVGDKTRITGTYDGANLSLYINGELEAQKAQTGKIGVPGYNTVMAIGANPLRDEATRSYANINVYSAKIYDVALTNAEINAWDVSAQQDGSIMAWTNNTSAPYTVYIGSEHEIFANQNSSRLFANIGYGTSCTATEALTNLNLLNVKSVTDMNTMFEFFGYKAMTSFVLPETFDTSNVTNMSSMFCQCGAKAMTELDLGTNFNTTSVTEMNNMFNQCGNDKLTRLDLSSGTDATNTTQFNTRNVNAMRAMFLNCGYQAMTSLNLGTNFDTTNVESMRFMFYNTGYNAMTSLSLGDKFDTSSVTSMYRMFNGCGYTAMTSLDLGDKFDTSSVTDMNKMFDSCGYTAITSLDLGDLFYTTSATDMYKMFYNCGKTAMTSLDLGPAFTKIPSETITKQASDYLSWEDEKALNYNAYDNFMTNCGKSGAVIYAPEATYKNRTSFKTSSGDTSTAAGTIATSTGRTIIPIYKPEWEKLSSAYDTTNKTLTLTVKGSAYESQTIDSNVTINYASDVTSTLSAEDITVYVNGVEVTSTVNPTVTVNAGTTSTNAGGATDITHTIVLSNLEEAARRADLPYKELSGNIKIKIGGRGEATSTYYDSANAILKDQYGNQNMMETDEGQTDGTWIDVTYSDPDTDRNTSNKMFADFIKPEFTYEASNTIIGDGNHGNTKKVTVVFDVTDKYFSNTELATDTNASLITVRVDNTAVNTTVNVTKTLTKKNDIIINTQTNVVTYQATGYTLGANEKKIGERYELLVEGLEQLDENGLSNGYTYSGPMSIAFPSGKITDLSGNVNDATTITIGVDDTDGNVQDTQDPNGEIVDVVDPVWELGDVDLENATIKLIAKDKYFDECTIDETKITVYANGVESTTIVKDITSIAPTNVLDTVGGVANTVVGKEYTLQLSNITPAEAGYTTFTPTNLTTDSLNNNAGFKYRDENGGDISIKIAAGTIKDQSGNTSREQDFEIGKIDKTKPEVYDVQKIQDAAANTETFIFNVTDRNYDPSDLVTEGEITVWVDGTQVTSIGKVITNKPIKLDIDGETGKILGHQYTLVLSNIAEAVKQSGKSYLEWSGTVEIRIAENAAKDLNGNTLNPDTTTISDFVDYIKPVMEPVTVTNSKNTTNKTYTMSFSIIDKYLDTTNMVTENEITVYVDGEEAASITKTLTSTPITATFKKTVDGVVEATATSHVIGHTYTLVLSDFEETVKQSGKDFMEWSGTVKIEIAENAVNDTEGNTLASDVTKRTVNGEHVDFIKPVVEKVSSTIDSTAKTETIIFNIMDKYLDTSDALTDSEISVYVDNDVVASGITKTLTKVQDFTATVNGDGTHVVGQQYQLVLSGFEQASRNAKDYKDWSGTVKIEIAENAVKDTSNNTLASEIAKRTINGDFVDFIKPDLEYIHQDTDINHGNKTYTMTFDVTDKYYTSGQLTLSDLTILMQNGQKDSDGNAIVYDLKQLATEGKINITFNGVDKTATFNKTVAGAVTNGEYTIGHTYTLTISNLEQLAIKEGNTTLDYSGIITVGVAADKVNDSGPSGDGTNPNGNNATTITSGVDITGGTESGTATVVDVVDPIWTKVSASASAIDPADKTSSTATITFRGTDTYFDQNTFTINDLKVIVNGSEVTTGITKTLDSTTELTEERIVDGVNTPNVKYGEEYTVTIKGFAQNANQVKIRIPKGLMVDQYGNDSEETDLIVYNVLKSAASETTAASTFLGESVATTIYPEGATSVTPIERQNIERVEFVNGIAGSKATGVQRVWDVSAQGDGSIIAWTSNTTAPYTVYIGSDDEIFANQDSSYLFSYIGYADTCTATEAVTNLNLLNVKSVTKMWSMFANFGYKSMTSLVLPETFDTSNVTDMNGMFFRTGVDEMTTLNLGTNFNTSNVTDMNNMFNACGMSKLVSLDLSSGTDATNTTQFNTINVNSMRSMFITCGYTAMTNLNLGANFDTTNVRDMSYMFSYTGYNSMPSLSLGEKFDTSNVTNMNRMFIECGYKAMTSLDLGDKFNTSNVTDMQKMFDSCGYTAMTSLDLGDLFYTTNVNDMYKMFYNCGKTAMTRLDLGPAFTKISRGPITKQASDYESWELDQILEYDAHDDFITGCGTSNLVIYVAEKIYYDKTTFKLGE